jgi:hypothetical protein
MSTVFVEEPLDRIDGDHNYGFCRLMKEFYDAVDFDGIEIFCIGYNAQHKNYYVALDNGINFAWNEESEKSTFYTTDYNTGKENEFDNYDDALSDLSY